MNNSRFIEFKTIFMKLLNKVVPLKTKYLRANYSKCMTKELSKAITLSKNRVVKSIPEKKTLKAKLKYNKQETCVSSLRKAKRNYYENLDMTNKIF